MAVSLACDEASAHLRHRQRYDVTVLKDATADYSEEFMHAALVTNLPNYASAIVSTQEITAALSGSWPLEQNSSAVGAPHG
ncbi:MAG: hypothetical protein WBQ89_21205 [Candidatus Acidiferrum sp.]